MRHPKLRRATIICLVLASQLVGIHDQAAAREHYLRALEILAAEQGREAPDFTLADPAGRVQVASRYRVIRHPHTVIIDRRGLIVGRADGERGWATPLAREWIARLLEGPAP